MTETENASFSFSLKDLVSIIPLFSFFALLFSTIYELGFFYVIGFSFIQYISISDMLINLLTYSVYILSVLFFIILTTKIALFYFRIKIEKLRTVHIDKIDPKPKTGRFILDLNYGYIINTIIMLTTCTYIFLNASSYYGYIGLYAYLALVISFLLGNFFKSLKNYGFIVDITIHSFIFLCVMCFQHGVSSSVKSYSNSQYFLVYQDELFPVIRYINSGIIIRNDNNVEIVLNDNKVIRHKLEIGNLSKSRFCIFFDYNC